MYRIPNTGLDFLPLARGRLYTTFPLPLAKAKVDDLRKLAQRFISNARAIEVIESLVVTEAKDDSSDDV